MINIFPHQFYSRDEDHSKSGDGVPALFVSNTGYICITFPLEGKSLSSGSCDERTVPLKTWSNLVVASIMEGSQVGFEEF